MSRLGGWVAVCGMASALAANAAGNITGRVVDSQTGEGIERARVLVQLTPPGNDQPVTLVALTNSEGTFGVRNLPGVPCRIWSERTGYLGGQNRTESQATIPISDAEATAPIVLQLTPQAVIEGSIVDPGGTGIAAWIKLYRVVPNKSGGIEFQRDLQVDESGEFRLAGLEAGSYYIEFAGPRAWVNQAKVRAYAVRFYPNAADLRSARSIQAKTGAVVQVTLQLHVAPSYQIRGRVPAASQNPSLSLRLPGEPAAGMQFFNAAWDDRNRSFSFSGVPPGVWLLEANFMIDGNAVQGSKIVTVEDADVDGVTIEPAARAN